MIDYNKLKQEIDDNRIIILEKEDAFALIKLLNAEVKIPWTYNFMAYFKVYKIENEYIVEPNKNRGGI